MIETPNPAAVLTAAYLEVTEELGLANQMAIAQGADPETLPPVLVLLTEKDASDAFTRIRFHEQQKVERQAQAAAMRAPLLEQMALIDSWEKDGTDHRDKRIAFHKSRLAAFFRMNPPAKGKTLKLPFGSISCRDQQPKWEWTKDDKALVAAVEAVKPDLVHQETVKSVNKNELKQAAVVRDGRAYLIIGEGEMVELPVTVTPQPDKVEIELATGA